MVCGTLGGVHNAERKDTAVPNFDPYAPSTDEERERQRESAEMMIANGEEYPGQFSEVVGMSQSEWFNGDDDEWV